MSDISQAKVLLAAVNAEPYEAVTSVVPVGQAAKTCEPKVAEAIANASLDVFLIDFLQVKKSYKNKKLCLYRLLPNYCYRSLRPL